MLLKQKDEVVNIRVINMCKCMADIRVEIMLLKLFTIINRAHKFSRAKKGRHQFDSGPGTGKMQYG